MINFVQLVDSYLGVDEEARSFALLFASYCHGIDDIIDGDKQDAAFIVQIFELAATLYSSDFYQKHIGELYPIVKSISVTYVTSVMLDRMTEGWAKQWAYILKSYGNQMMVAICQIVNPTKALEFNLKLIELSQLNKD